jgi:hypothetical protein
MSTEGSMGDFSKLTWTKKNALEALPLILGYKIDNEIFSDGGDANN